MDPEPHHLERPPYRVAPPADTLGTRHIVEALRDLTFPMTRDELLGRAGKWRIPITGTHFHPLAELLDGVDRARFRSARDVASAVARVHPELRD